MSLIEAQTRGFEAEAVPLDSRKKINRIRVKIRINTDCFGDSDAIRMW
jgi:hypothetical protein